MDRFDLKPQRLEILRNQFATRYVVVDDEYVIHGQCRTGIPACLSFKDTTKLDEIRRQIDAATANGQFDEAQVRPLANQQAQLMADEMIDRLRTHSKLFSLLTAEQRTKADHMMKMHGEPRRGPGFGHGPPPPPPGF